MRQTRCDLEETIDALREALRSERSQRLALLEKISCLRQENEHLLCSLIQASMRYRKLTDYVKRLNAWASERAP